MPEKLAFEQLPWHGPAIDRYERSGSAGLPVMVKEPGNDFLACPGFALYQHGYRSIGAVLLGKIDDLPHGVGVNPDIAQPDFSQIGLLQPFRLPAKFLCLYVDPFLKLRFQTVIVVAEGLVFQGPLNRYSQLPDIDRLLKIVGTHRISGP